MASRIDMKKIENYLMLPVEELKDHPDSKITFKIFKNPADVAILAGDMMYDEVVENNKAGKMTRWVWPGGPIAMYNRFIERVNRDRVSLHNVHIFMMDDYLDFNCRPLPPENIRFNIRARMEKNVFSQIDKELIMPLSQIHYPLYNDLDAIDIAIEKLGGIDTVFGGLGFTGLVAYCEAPRSPWYTVTEEQYCQMKTRIFPINDDSIIAYAQRGYGGLTHVIPPLSVTIGMKSLLTAKRVIFVSTTGEWKRTAVRMLAFGEPTVEYPATLFPGRVDEVILIADENTVKPPLTQKGIL